MRFAQASQMQKTLEQSDREFLDRLQRLGRVKIQEICEDLGVTATAVRQRLSRLFGAGYVERELVRSGRGRPHHVYSVTPKGLRELGDNYGDLAQILWRELKNISDTDIRNQVTNRVRDALAARYSGQVRSTSLPVRFRELGAALVEQGYDVEVDYSNNLPILRENNCPYQDLADQDRGICEMEEEVFEQVLGVPVKLAKCCMDGHHCCQFELVQETTD